MGNSVLLWRYLFKSHIRKFLFALDNLHIHRHICICFSIVSYFQSWIYLAKYYSHTEAAIGGVLKNFVNFTGKHLCWSFFFNKKRLQHRCFPLKFSTILRTPILKNIYVLLSSAGFLCFQSMIQLKKTLIWYVWTYFIFWSVSAHISKLSTIIP